MRLIIIRSANNSHSQINKGKERDTMKKIVWNYLSSFGIMFAILSWIQESNILLNDIGYEKGVLAAIFGFVLYKIIGSKV